MHSGVVMESNSDSSQVALPLSKRRSSETDLPRQRSDLTSVETYQLDSRMRIIFVNPNLRPGNPTGKYLPVGLGYVMTVFKNAGLDYELLDICLYDYTNDHVENHFRDNGYDVVLIGSIVTHYKWMKWFTHMVKQYQPNCKVIVGNSVAGSIPLLWMDKTPTDYIVTGEGEWAALDIIRHLETGSPPEDILGITFRNSEGTAVVTGKRPAVRIQDIPMIDWSDFNVEGYHDVKKSINLSLGVELTDGEELRVMPVSTARGCVFKCTFCHYVFWDDPYRHRTPDDILAECKQNIEVYGANYIDFWDDLSFHSLQSTEQLVDAIIASDLRFYWTAAIRADLFGNPKIAEERRITIAHKLREAGCVNIGFSIESGNDEILEMMNKKVEVEYFNEAVRILRLAGLSLSTAVVFGYPIETPQTIRETFDQCAKNAIYPSIGILIPLPYTEMYEYAKEHGYITDEDIYLTSITERQDLCLNMTQMSDEEFMNCIQEGASALNEQLGLGLNDLIKTGKQPAHKGSKLTRNQNDFSFNYAEATFHEKSSTG